MIPSANSESWLRAPPLNRLRKPRMLPPAKFVLDRVERVDVDAGRRDEGAEPVEREHRRREGELAPDLGDRKGVADRAEHRLGLNAS